MTKVKTRLLSITGLLACASLTTGCFTPAGYAEHGAAEEHGAEPGAEHAEHADAEPAAGDGKVIVEGIKPGTAPRKLDIKAPEIAYEAPYDGKPLSSKTVAQDIVIEEFALGTGDDVVAENKLVEFSFKGYSTINANQVMGSRMAPAKMVINESTRARDPIAAAMADAMLGMKVGGKRRVKIPSSIIEKDAPPGRPAIGDLMMVVEIVSLADAPVLASAEAYAGVPVASKKLDNGLEIYDYAEGEGRAAKAGDQVITHYVGQLTDGTEFDSSHSRAEGLAVVLGGGGVIPGFSQGLEGAKVGMLRKVVIPPELGYGGREQGKIPADSTLVFLLQNHRGRRGARDAADAPGHGWDARQPASAPAQAGQAGRARRQVVVGANPHESPRRSAPRALCLRSGRGSALRNAGHDREPTLSGRGLALGQVLLPLADGQLLELVDGGVELGNRRVVVALVAELLGLDGGPVLHQQRLHEDPVGDLEHRGHQPARDRDRQHRDLELLVSRTRRTRGWSARRSAARSTSA